MDLSGSGGPAPFLLKTYEMIDDTCTDEIVSWSSNDNSFVVWNPPEFARLLLPTYFKHNNFSSFIRQLNTYGFRKVDSERWEFANEDFVKDKKHLLKNIHRRKPIHSHSIPQNFLVDQEKAAFAEEIERLICEKNALEADCLRFKQQHAAAKLHLEELTQRVTCMEHRQENVLTLLEKGIENKAFMEHLSRKIESMDFPSYNKKRRLPQLDHSLQLGENDSVEEHSSSRQDFGDVIHQDSPNMLNLQRSPKILDINMVSNSTQSSNEDVGILRRRESQGEQRDIASAPEIDLSDTGTSFKFNIDLPLCQEPRMNEIAKPQSLQKTFYATEESDDHISVHLNLTLASSPLQVDEDFWSAKMSQLGSNGKGFEFSLPRKNNFCDGNTEQSSFQRARDYTQVLPVTQVRVNDVFWEQFLTEKPGSCDTEEFRSKLGTDLCENQEGRRPGQGISGNTRDMEQLTL